MDKTLFKFVILWTVCETIGLTTSIPLKDTVHEDSNTRVKRSPADNFSLFGFQLGSPFSKKSVTKAKESLSNFGNIFGPAAIPSQSGNTNRDRQPIESHSVNNMKYTNNGPISPMRMSPTEDSYKSGIAVSGVNKVDKNNLQQEDTNKVNIKSAPEKYQLSNDKSNSNTNLVVPERQDEATEHNADNQVIDQQLIDYIFQVKPDNNIDYTTVDTNTDYTTETGEYETTTEELLRIPSAVVASLLG